MTATSIGTHRLYQICSFKIPLSRLIPHVDEPSQIICVEFDIIHQILIKYSTSVRAKIGPELL
jgi:hypothetical protein